MASPSDGFHGQHRAQASTGTRVSGDGGRFRNGAQSRETKAQKTDYAQSWGPFGSRVASQCSLRFYRVAPEGERSNLNLRMRARRFTRLTNGFSKNRKTTGHVTLWYTCYNFCRIHKSLPVTPAMAHKITDHVWSVAELLM
jgi:hypothetical protein